MDVTSHHDEPPWSYLYITALEACGLPHTAAKMAGVSLARVNKLAQERDEFRFACEQAEERFVDSLEAEAIRRARDGVVEGVYHQGNRIDDKTVYSDTLMVQLLKGRRGRTFGDKKEVRMTGHVEVVLAPIAQFQPGLPAPAAPIDSTATLVNTALEELL